MIASIVKLTKHHLTDELKDLYKQLSHGNKDPEADNQTMTQWMEDLERRGDEVFVYVATRSQRGDATSFDTFIGGVGTIVYDEKLLHGGCRAAHIEDVVVREDLRGLGAGKSIVDYLVSRARKKGCYKISLVCKEELQSFYVDRGFTEGGKNMVMRF